MIDPVEAFECPRVFSCLDALQIRADTMVFSKETASRGSSMAALQRVFGTPTLAHSEVDAILREVHTNYLRLARDTLLLE